jgi:hypothetical protein
MSDNFANARRVLVWLGDDARGGRWTVKIFSRVYKTKVFRAASKLVLALKGFPFSNQLEKKSMCF